MSFEGAKEFKAPQPYIRNKLDPILAIERRWKLYDGRRACTPMDIKDFGLSLHKAPPPLFDWSYYTAQPRGADSTDAAKASKAEHPLPVTARPTYRFFDSAPAQQARGLAPFDLYDLPAAMRAEDFPIAAQFAERWFHGRQFDAHRYDAKKRTYVEGRYDPPEHVYYPVRNRDFRAWQEAHQRGGDFLVYSDMQHLALREPIRVDLGVEC